MNRVIKFRAWDIREGLNKMYFNVSFIPYGDGWQGGNPAHKFYQIFHGNGGFFLSDMNNIVLMQFSGLHDKNGKEIYEGDIMQRDSHWARKKTGQDVVTVSFEDGRYILTWDDGVKTSLYTLIKDFFIIGNIYENPELLTNG